MKLMTLSQFQELTGLSDSALLYLLRENRLRCGVDDSLGLCVDVDSADNTAMLSAMRARQNELAAEHAPEIAERVGALLQEEIEKVVDEALEKLKAA